MVGRAEKRERALQALQDAVEEAVACFQEINANLFDGYQTAHEVLAHLVFWQCEHLGIAQALAAGEQPDLKTGTLADLNRGACEELRSEPVDALLARLTARQAALDAVLRELDWAQEFPLKQGGRPSTVEDRVFGLAAHIRQHVMQLRRAAYTKQVRSTLN
ncbi:MAG: DinB family protein [Anaerolineae bacterium]|nr:DinB family protein [Anaerolineae bacterium]